MAVVLVHISARGQCSSWVSNRRIPPPDRHVELPVVQRQPIPAEYTPEGSERESLNRRASVVQRRREGDEHAAVGNQLEDEART